MLAAYLEDRLPHRRTAALLLLAEVLLGILQAESAVHRSSWADPLRKFLFAAHTATNTAVGMVA